jgi:cell division protein FtsL
MKAALRTNPAPRGDGGQLLHGGAIAMLGAVVLMSAVAVVYAKYESRTLFAELQSLKQAQDRMDVEWGQLQLEQSTWAAHGRIESIARKRLGMVLPEPQQVVVIKP